MSIKLKINIKNKHKKDISSLSPLTKKKILEVVDYLEKQAEITPSSTGIIYPVIGSDTDDYNDRLIIKKLAEWKVLKILSVDIPSRPNYFEVMSSLEKLRHIKNLIEAKEMPEINGNRKSDYPLELVLAGKVLKVQGYVLQEPVHLITIQAVGSATLFEPLFKICRSQPTSWKTISKKKIEATVGYDKISSFKEVLKELTKFSKYTSGVGLKGALRSLFIGKVNDQTGIKIRIAVPIKDWNNLPTKKQEEVVNRLLEISSSRS